jgi:hypothetical protein
MMHIGQCLVLSAYLKEMFLNPTPMIKKNHWRGESGMLPIGAAHRLVHSNFI